MKTHDIIESKNNIYIICEHCNYGDMGNMLKKFHKMKERHAKKVLRGVVKGYSEIYNKNIIHRDLKPANIFI